MQCIVYWGPQLPASAGAPSPQPPSAGPACGNVITPPHITLNSWQQKSEPGQMCTVISIAIMLRIIGSTLSLVGSG